MDNALVHKTDAEETLLADCARLGDDRFLFSLRWPENHSLYHCADDGSSDPVLAVESLRQAAIFIFHRYYDVPLGDQFILSDFALDVTDPRGLPSGPAVRALQMDVRCTVQSRRGRHAGSISADFRLAGRTLAHCVLRYNALPRATYEMLRRRAQVADSAAGSEPIPRAPGPMLPPRSVGRRHAADVVLRHAGSEPEEPWMLHVDTDHPIYFDHPLDHVPGMLLFEALRQSSHAAAWSSCGADSGGLALVGATARYPAFCELGPEPVLLEVVRAGGDEGGANRREVLSYAVTARQRGVEVVSGVMRWARTSAVAVAALRHGFAAAVIPHPARPLDDLRLVGGSRWC